MRTREILGILSRTPSPERDTLRGVLKRAKAQHLYVDRLEYTIQGP